MVVREKPVGIEDETGKVFVLVLLFFLIIISQNQAFLTALFCCSIALVGLNHKLR